MSRGILTAIVRNPVAANLLAVSILVAGGVIGLRMPREAFPDTSVDYVLITVPYPGASPLDVEAGICTKVEQAIGGIAGLREIVSFATDDVGQVFAEFDASLVTADEVIRDVRDRVSAITSFPSLAEQPVISEMMIRSPVINVGVGGDAPEETIRSVAEEVRRRLLRRPEISQVTLSGARDREISIRVSREALERYGLTLGGLTAAISAGSLDLPAGALRSGPEEISVRTIGQHYTVEDYQDLVVIARPDGTMIRLGQIADVRDAFEETPVYGRINGKPGIMLAVSRTAGEDISRIAAIVREFVTAAQAELPDGLELSTWGDASVDVDARIDMLIESGAWGLLLVLLCLMLFLDWRTSLCVALGIPVAYAGALVMLGLTGATLNMITLMGLLMATGIIVDDAIVVAERVRAEARTGKTPELAAVDGTRSVALPVLMSSATTVMAFLPLMAVDGVMGKLIFVLPIAVIAAIGASALEAFVILPAHLVELTRDESSGGGRDSAPRRLRRRVDAWLDDVITRGYGPVLRRCLPWRWVVVGGSVALIFICAGAVLGGRTAFVMFPDTDGNVVRAQIRFPEGTPIAVTEAAVEQMEAAALALNDDLRPDAPNAQRPVQHLYSVVGEWGGYTSRRGSFLGETTLELTPAEERGIDVGAIIEQWRKRIGVIPQASALSIRRQAPGPGERPIEIRLLGEDLDRLKDAAAEVRAKLATYEGVFDVDDSLPAGKRELRVRLKEAAGPLGLTVADLASQLRRGLLGSEVLRLQRGDDELRVVVAAVERDRGTLGAVENLSVRTPAGALVPFVEVADTEMTQGYSTIARQAGLRRVTVRADADVRYTNVEQVIRDMEENFLPGLDARHPGVTYVLDGERKRLSESFASLLRASAIAAVAGFALMGTVLRSYVRPLIIMTAIPLGFVGAVAGHWLLGYDLSLMSVFGMVALAGIVVNDSLVLIDEINRNLGCRGGVAEAVVNAATARFRAIMLTSVTTVAGMLPLLAERSAQAQSLIPMAVSIAFGLAFATVLTLLVVPALYLALNDLKRAARWLWRGGAFPTADAVDCPV